MESDGSRTVSVRHNGSDFNRIRVDTNSFNFMPRINLAADRHAADVGVVETTIDVVQRQTCTPHSLHAVQCRLEVFTRKPS